MFERFTRDARAVVVHAQEIARERHDALIGPEHLLLGLYAVPGGPAVAVLATAGIAQADVEADLARPPAADAEALATLGIDLDEVRSRVEEAFGPGALDRTRAARGRFATGHIPFDGGAKKALELALREAVRMRSGEIGTQHVLLGLLHDGRARDLLAARGLDLQAARTLVDQVGRRAG